MLGEEGPRAEGLGPLDTAGMPTFFAVATRRAGLWQEGRAPAAPDPFSPVIDHPDAHIPEPEGRHPTRHMALLPDVHSGNNPGSHTIGRSHRQLTPCGTDGCAALLEMTSVQRVARKRAGAAAVVQAADACTLCVRGTRAGAARLVLVQIRHVSDLLRRFATLHGRPHAASSPTSPPLNDEAVGRASLAALRLAAHLVGHVRALDASEVDAVRKAVAGAAVDTATPGQG